MKNILKYKYLLLAVVLLGFTSCADDDLDFPESNKPVGTLIADSSDSVDEGGTVMFTVNLDRPISVDTDFKIDLLQSSSGSMDDFTTTADHLDEYEVGPEGWQVTIPATETTVSFEITFNRDLDQSEDMETFNFRMTRGQQGNAIVADGRQNFTVRVADFKFCSWTFEMTDLYGDGWNGGYLEVATDSATTDYYAMDEDGLVGVAETTTVEVPIGVGEDYTITYVSGGGTGAGPGWESENVYTLTAPDGTQFMDGPIPAEGVVTSGTSTCN